MRITKANLKNGKVLEFGDINIFVGPNGVGKTTLVKEIVNNATTNGQGKYWVASSDYDALDSEDAKEIIKEMKLVQGNRTLFYRRNENGEINNAGTQVFREPEYDALNKLAKNQTLTEEEKQLIKNRQRELIRNLIGFEPTRQRLQLSGEVEAGDTRDPAKIYDHLNKNPTFVKEIDKQFTSIFGVHFCLLKHCQKVLQLGFAKLNEKPPKKGIDEIEAWREKNLIPLNEAGDGMHASATMFFSLFNPSLKVVLIDEPEVFIYPSQKKKIAKAIKDLALKIGKEQGKQTFIVTHDATLLSGLVDNAQDGESIKLFYVKDRTSVIPLTTEGAKVKPTTKQPKYLQMLFHHGTIISEGPNDRYLYEETITEIHKARLNEKDIAFIEIGGASNGSMHIAHLIKNAEIKATYIFDLDVVADSGSGNYKAIKDVYLTISGKKTFKELDVLRKLITDNKKGSSYKDNKGIKDLKWHRDNKAQFEKIFKELNKYGIFIVPQGGLESWAEPDENWPYSGAKEIINKPNTNGFEKFSSEILNYLLGKAKSGSKKHS